MRGWRPVSFAELTEHLLRVQGQDLHPAGDDDDDDDDDDVEKIYR
jgi:hypothetical protein